MRLQRQEGRKDRRNEEVIFFGFQWSNDDQGGDCMIPGYDEWKTSPPEVPPVTTCTCCGCDLYEGDYLYTVDGENLCADCMNDNYRRML